MTNVQTRLLRINAALDGELSAMDQAAFDRELGEDPALAREFARLSAVREATRRAAPRERAPSGLADRIAALGKAPGATVVPLSEAAARRPERTPSSTGRAAMGLAASFAALGFALGVGLTALRTGDATREADAPIVSDFARAAIAGQPYDVASSDRHTVKPWLAVRTTVSADIVDLAAQGYPLAGGRVTVVDRVPAPTLVYRHNEHFVALTELPSSLARTAGDGAVESVDGYHVARWLEGGLGFIAVTDADEAALAKFVSAFRTARKGVGE